MLPVITLNIYVHLFVANVNTAENTEINKCGFFKWATCTKHLQHASNIFWIRIRTYIFVLNALLPFSKRDRPHYILWRVTSCSKRQWRTIPFPCNLGRALRFPIRRHTMILLLWRILPCSKCRTCWNKRGLKPKRLWSKCIKYNMLYKNDGPTSLSKQHL